MQYAWCSHSEERANCFLSGKSRKDSVTPSFRVWCPAHRLEKRSYLCQQQQSLHRSHARIPKFIVIFLIHPPDTSAVRRLIRTCSSAEAILVQCLNHALYPNALKVKQKRFKNKIKPIGRFQDGEGSRIRASQLIGKVFLKGSLHNRSSLNKALLCSRHYTQHLI